MSHIRHKQFTRTKKKAFSSKPRWWPIRPSISSVHVLFCCCQHLQFHLVLIKTQPWKGYEALFGISSAIWLMFSAPTHSWQSRGNRVTGLKCFITTEAYPQYSCSADHCRAGLHYHVYHLSDPKLPPSHLCLIALYRKTLHYQQPSSPGRWSQSRSCPYNLHVLLLGTIHRG